MRISPILFSSAKSATSLLLGKKCLITGGSQGIGLAIAQKFAQEGASIVLLARNKDTLLKAVSTLPSLSDSQKHSFAMFDVSARKQFTDSDIGTKLSEIDILVNSAGISQSSLLLTTPKDCIDSIVDTNLLGTIYSCQSMIKPMIRRRGGCIINISSVLGLCGVKGTSVYAASKAGVIGFTKALAVELGSRNIRANVICPGLVDTDMAGTVNGPLREMYTQKSPTKQLIPTDEIANAALSIALLKHMNGSVLTIDGGFTA